MKTKDEYKGISGLVGAAFLYSFFGVLTRMLGFSLPMFYAIWTRDLVAIAILGIVLLLTKQWVSIQPKDWKWFVLRTVGGFFGLVGSYISFYYIPIGTAYFIFYGGTSVGGYLLGRIMFGETLTRIKIVALVLAIVGLLLIFSLNMQASSSWYALFALVAGFGTAIWNTFSKKISSTYSALQLNLMDFALGFVLIFILSLIYKDEWVAPSLNVAWLSNLLFVVMFIGTGQLIVYGFRRLSAQIGSLVMLSEVLFGIVWGVLIYHETLSFLSIVGGVLILMAIMLPEIRLRKRYV